MEEWITIKEAVDKSGLSRSTIYRGIRDGIIKARKEGKTRLVLSDSVSEYQTDETYTLADELRRQIEELRQQLTNKDKVIEQQKSELSQLRTQIEQMQERHDQIVMGQVLNIQQQQKLIGWYSQPWWRRFKRKPPTALPEPENSA